MGNSGSGQGEEKKPQSNSSKIAIKTHHKLLLDLNYAPKLRPTENGTILQEGGTLSFRKKEKESESINEGDIYQSRRNIYGSEPDLRLTSYNRSHINCHSPNMRETRTRKKYKAPKAPKVEPNNNCFFDDWDPVQNTRPTRRLRFFKTRMDLRRKPPQFPTSSYKKPSSVTLIRSLSSPQLQIDSINTNEESSISGSEESTSINLNINPIVSSHHRRKERHQSKKKYAIGNFIENKNQENLYNQSKQEEIPSYHSSLCIDGDFWALNHKTSMPIKKFYFGMNIDENKCPADFDMVPSNVKCTTPSSSESFKSSNDGCTHILYDEINGGISVQIRATLPRKQIEIPRFSPSAAWRMLSITDKLRNFQEDDVIPVENRILAPPHPVQIPTPVDKSADSGISGDASPQQNDLAAWTPQQDLEETSSDGGFPSNSFSYRSLEGKYIPRFTVSLPKDDMNARFSSLELDTSYQANSLKSGKISNRTDYKLRKKSQNILNVKENEPLDNNWLLSCNLPQPLNIRNISRNNEDSLKIFQDDEGMSLSKKPSYSYIRSGGHIMYLPEYSQSTNPDHMQSSLKYNDLNNFSETDDHHHSEIQSPVTNRAKTKKFTFQSTLKQNERKLLAEKLSKQAEHTESKRRSEQEIMQKVEEEFQKKREKEKADIRQQLRLYSINNNDVLFASLQNQTVPGLIQPMNEC